MSTTAVRCQAKNPATCRNHGTPAGSLSSVLKQLSTGVDARDLAAQFFAKRAAEEAAEFVVIDKDGKPHAPYKVAPEGALPLCCTNCNARFTEKMREELWSDGSSKTRCSVCNEGTDWGAVQPYIVEVAHDNAKYLSDPSEVLDTVWYHTTDQADWYEGVMDAGIYVHVGTEQAAMERFNTQDSQYRDNDFVIHAVRIKQGVTVDDRIFLDENEWLAKTDASQAASYELTEAPYGPDKVNRYVNEWEAPGQVSLILNPDLIEVVSTRTLQSKKPRWQDQVREESQVVLNPWQQKLLDLHELGRLDLNQITDEERKWLVRKELI